MFGGLVTGIGSLPGKDTDLALELILEKMPYAPHWPQLPQRGKGEGFVLQFLNPLLKSGLLVNEGKDTVFDTNNPLWEEKVKDFYALAKRAKEDDLEALEQFSLPKEFGEGFYAFLDKLRNQENSKAHYYKGHLAGPLTISFILKDKDGNLSCQNELLRDILVKTLSLSAKWQIKTLASLGKKIIIFVDEPAMGILTNSDVELKRENILKDLNEVCEEIQKQDALTGVHSCDAMDWSLLFESKAQIVNFDSYQFGLSLFPYLTSLKSFLKRGGILAWGMIPTKEEAFLETGESLFYKLNLLWEELGEKGVDQNLLKKQAMITPACGVGLLKVELANHIYNLAKKLGEMVYNLKGE